MARFFYSKIFSSENHDEAVYKFLIEIPAQNFADIPISEDEESIKLEIVDEDITFNNDESENGENGENYRKNDENDKNHSENDANHLENGENHSEDDEIDIEASSEDDSLLAERLKSSPKTRKRRGSSKLFSGKIVDDDEESIKLEIVDEDITFNNDDLDPLCKDAESIKLEIVDEDVDFNIAEDAKRCNIDSSKGRKSDGKVAEKKGLVKKEKKRCSSSKRYYSGKMFNDVKKNMRLYCCRCKQDADLDVVAKSKSKPSCENCPESLVFICNFCEAKLSNLFNSYWHLQRSCKSTKAKFRCTKCSYKAKRKFTLKQHIKNQHTAEKCRECGQTINTDVDFYQHQLSKCPYEFNRNSFVATFCCDICGFFTKQKGNLIRHIRSQHKTVK